MNVKRTCDPLAYLVLYFYNKMWFKLVFVRNYIVVVLFWKLGKAIIK